MTRTGSQLTFCSPEHILRRMVVEQNEQNIVTRLFSLDDGLVESEQTLFFDGILSVEIVSVKLNTTGVNISELSKDYQYLDLSEVLPTVEIVPVAKPLLVDFGTNSLDDINHKLSHLANVFAAFTIFDIIAACSFYPALWLGQPAALVENRQTKLLLWEGVDLKEKRFTERTRIRQLN